MGSFGLVVGGGVSCEGSGGTKRRWWWLEIKVELLPYYSPTAGGMFVSEGETIYLLLFIV